MAKNIIQKFIEIIARLFSKPREEGPKESSVPTGDYLSPNFKLSELTRSATATRLGISNTPSKEHLNNLYDLAVTLELVRVILGNNPILITSGYRSPELNKAVGGSATSDHANGLAADFSCPDFGTVEEVCKAIAESDLPFDQLIFEQKTSHWVHLGIGTRMRRQVMSWSPKAGYVPGVRRLV